MRLAGHLLSFAAGIVCAGILFATLSDSTSAPESTALVADAAVTPAVAQPTPQPANWIERLRAPRGAKPPQRLSCLDANNDGRLNGADGSWFFAALDVPLVAGYRCHESGHGADFYESALLPSFNCDRTHAPLFFVVIAGGGSDLLDASMGDSLGLLDVTNALFDRAQEIDLPITLTLSSGAIVGAEMPQSNLERLLADYIANRLALVPCARAALLGHSHGGVTVSTVTSMLDDRFADRLIGVMVDRTNVIYDRPADDFPARVPLLNIFQTNEGWHGATLPQPNITNHDLSSEMGPGYGAPARVTHRTLDDSPAVQQRILEALLAFATRP